MENKVIGIVIIIGDVTVNYYIDTSFVNFFLRNQVSTKIINASKEISYSATIGKIHCINFDHMTDEFEHLDNTTCTICKSEYVSIVILTKNYKHQRVIAELAHKLMTDMKKNGKVDDLQTLAKNYEHPEAIDKIVQVQSEIDKTMDVVNITMDKLRMRERDINELVTKTKDLEDAADKFVIDAKKLNSCCVIL